eukprot:363864-Chlamydomonas_euryale.AAC.20
MSAGSAEPASRVVHLLPVGLFVTRAVARKWVAADAPEVWRQLEVGRRVGAGDYGATGVAVNSEVMAAELRCSLRADPKMKMRLGHATRFLKQSFPDSLVSAKQRNIKSPVLASAYRYHALSCTTQLEPVEKLENEGPTKGKHVQHHWGRHNRLATACEREDCIHTTAETSVGAAAATWIVR